MERHVLACDVGGTNTSIALVSGSGTSWTIRYRYRAQTQALESLEEAVDAALGEIDAEPTLPLPTIVSVSGAGPIRNGVCYLSNVSWRISEAGLADHTGLKALLINDFSAISFGIPLLDRDNESQIGILSDSVSPVPGGVRLVVGAGTGLGVGYLVQDGPDLRVYPSEGGHAPFAPYDDVSRGLQAMLAEEQDDPPGSELFVSGRGIANIRRYYKTRGWIPETSAIAGTVDDTAVQVSMAAQEGDSAAVAIMKTFVRNYARVAAAAALHFLPAGGLYLAGGIVSKNERWFAEDDLFLHEFRRNYRDHLVELLRQFPVFVVRDYEISLYGAAHAAAVRYRQEDI